jgi:hypothetical protein
VCCDGVRKQWRLWLRRGDAGCVWGECSGLGLGSGQKPGFLRDGEEVEEDWRTGGRERDHGNVEKRLSETNRHATKIMRVCMWRDGREGCLHKAGEGKW